MPFGYLIQERERGVNITWISANHTVHRGPVSIFEATKKERWLQIIVKTTADLSINTVSLASARPESDEVLQIMHKTDLYQLSDKIHGVLYHPIGIAHIDLSSRLRRHRITSDEVSENVLLRNILEEFVKSRIKIKKYEEVTSKLSKGLNGKLCTVVQARDTESMAVAFIGEKVVPLIG